MRSVGNELVNTGKASASQVVAAIGTAKAALKAQGYNGPITTIDAMSEYPFRGFRPPVRLRLDSSEMLRKTVLLLLLS